MTEKYSVYQHWDTLKVCIVGKSYAPEFYSFIKNPRVRTVFEQIAQETEEDYQKLIKLLESFGVEILRPNIKNNHEECRRPYHTLGIEEIIEPPPMTPRDYSISLGDKFFFMTTSISDPNQWNIWKGSDWPDNPPRTLEEFLNLPTFIQEELKYFIGIGTIAENSFKLLDYNIKNFNKNHFHHWTWKDIITKIQPKFENLYAWESPEIVSGFNSAMMTRIGKDIYCGTEPNKSPKDINKLKEMFPEYRWHTVNTQGHADGTFCPVVPGLIVSLMDIPTYKDTFPDWEVIYLPNQSWNKVHPFLKVKEKNYGKWWVPGQELNDDFNNFVEEWMGHWVGYVEETVFDVNMLVIDEKNVVCNNYNEKVFRAFDRYGITPHVINFRHRYFWDGGLHCITSDVHREGTMKDYFPERREI